MLLVRQEIGDVLRDFRLQKGQTLRQVAGRATVALGYLSEVERGQKEASSEILASLADALEVPISVIMREVSDRLALVEGINIEGIGIEGIGIEGIELGAMGVDSFATEASKTYIPDTFPASFLADSDPELAATH